MGSITIPATRRWASETQIREQKIRGGNQNELVTVQLSNTLLEANLERNLRSYFLLFSVAGISIFLDQWTKTIIKNNLDFSAAWMPLEWLAPYARIIHWKNTGAAFGMGQNLNWVFAILAIFVIGAILYYYPEFAREGLYARIALGLMLGGAAGNLIDRLIQGHVTDFISVGTFPVFNIADASISIGTALMILGMLISERRKAAKLDSEALVGNESPNPELTSEGNQGE